MGSKTGWILALALVVAVAAAAYLLIAEPWPSPPRDTKEPGFLELKSVRIPLGDVIGMEPTEPGNAADDYHKAVQVYIAHAGQIEAVGDHEVWDAVAAAKELWADPAMGACREIAAHLAAGARKKTMEYSWIYSPKTVRVRFHHDHATRLFKVAVAAHLLHMIHRDRREYAQAEQILKDMLVLGLHMFEERMLAHMSMEGLEIQTSAVTRLQELYGRWPEAPKHRLPVLRQYESRLRVITENVRKKKKYLWDYIPAKDMGKPVICAGDVYNVAENDADRAWRVQAVVALGPLKYLLTSRGDSVKTNRLIQESLRSSDPLIASAAKAADALTREEFRGLGTAFDQETPPE